MKGPDSALDPIRVHLSNYNIWYSILYYRVFVGALHTFKCSFNARIWIIYSHVCHGPWSQEYSAHEFLYVFCGLQFAPVFAVTVTQGHALVLAPKRWWPCGSTRFAPTLTTERCTTYSTWHSNHTFGAVCHSRKVGSFPLWEVVTAACAVMPALILPPWLCRRILLQLALTTTATLEDRCLINIQNFPAAVGLYYRTAVLSTLKYNSVIARTSIITKFYLPSRTQEYITIFIVISTRHSTSSAF